MPLPSHQLTVAAFARDWLDRVRSAIRPKTYESYEGALRVHLVPKVGHLRLAKLDSLVKTPSSSGGNGRIMWGKGVGAAPGRGRGACSERETRKRASGSPSSW